MIIYDKLWETMKKAGVSKYRLREKYLFDYKTLKRLQDNDNVEVKTLDKLCEVLNCSLEDVATYVN